MLLDGRKARAELTEKLKVKVVELGFQPVLAIVQVGDRPDSSIYIEKKVDYAKSIGCLAEHFHLSATSDTEKVEELICQLNEDKRFSGIIVQLPLPEHLNGYRIIEKIRPAKDADGLTGYWLKKFYKGEPALIPATTAGILHLLDYYNISLRGSKAVVISRSFLVGKPTALAFINQGATVTVCHRETNDLPFYTRPADLIVSATGRPGLITEEFVSPGQTIVDVGINIITQPDSKLKVRGDVDQKTVLPIVENITPVPGGVGPMTVYALFANLVDLCEDK